MRRHRHEIQCQLRQSLRNPTKTVSHSVPEVELCLGALLCNAAKMDTLPLWARTSLTSWQEPIKIANATQFAVRRVA